MQRFEVCGGNYMSLEEKQNQIVANIETINEFLANSNCSDCMSANYNGCHLRLIGSFDLCYYSEIEILFKEVSYISMYTYFGLWDLKQKPFKVKFGTNDMDSLFEIHIGEDMDGKTHVIWCDSMQVYIGIQGLEESVFA